MSMTRVIDAPSTSSDSVVHRCLENLKATLRRRQEELVAAMGRGDIVGIRRLLLEISDESSLGSGPRVVMNLRSMRRTKMPSPAELRDVALIYDRGRRRFKEGQPELVKEAARELFPEATFSTFMSRERDGIHIRLRDGRIDVMPGSVYIWTAINDQVKRFLEFLERKIFTA